MKIIKIVCNIIGMYYMCHIYIYIIMHINIIGTYLHISRDKYIFFNITFSFAAPLVFTVIPVIQYFTYTLMTCWVH